MIYWVWLKLLQGIGPHTQRRLLKAFESPKDVYRASTDDLISAGLSDKKAQLVSVTKDLSGPERVLERCVRSGISLVNISQRDFPDRLRILDDMPVLLFYKGGLFEPERTAGIVGPRRCTQETKEKVINVTTRCLKEGQAIISGMALGVDGYAHTAAVKNGGRTIAVVGTGLDICFPKEHETLFEAIENNGCIFSEYEPGQPALSCHFPRRNALIAALSDELHVIDAGRNSGAMITAEYAKKYGKRVRKQDGSNAYCIFIVFPLMPGYNFVHSSCEAQEKEEGNKFNMNQMTNVEKKRIEALDKKIEKLKKKVIAKQSELDVIEEELMMLIEERHPERKEERIKQELYDAYLKNNKSVEEIIKLIENPDILDHLDWIE